jgi:hypothetical protein
MKDQLDIDQRIGELLQRELPVPEHREGYRESIAARIAAEAPAVNPGSRKKWMSALRRPLPASHFLKTGIHSHRRRTLALVGAAAVLVVGGAVGAPLAAHYVGDHDVRVVGDDRVAGDGTDTTLWQRKVQNGIWTRLPLRYEGAEVTYLAIDPTNSAVLYASTNRGLFKSVDAAESWRQLSSLTGVDWIAVDPASASTIFVVRWMDQDPQLMRSLDGGETWKDVGAQIMPGPDSELLGAIDAPFFDTSSRPSTVYLPMASGFWRSRDEGGAWVKLSAEEEQQASAMRSTAVHACVSMGDVLAYPTDSAICYRPTVHGVTKSTDGGTRWQQANNGLTSSDTVSLAVDESSPATLYVATPAGIVKSVDAGKTWASILGGGAGEGADGSSWYAGGSVVVSPSVASRVYARTSFGLFRSDNGGADWTSLAGQGLPSTTVAAPGAPAAPAGTGLAGATDPSLGVMDPLLLVAMDNPDVVFIRSDDAVYRSADGGRTWSKVLDGAGKVVADPRASSTLYALLWNKGEILKSVDDGAVWSVLTSGPWLGSPVDLVLDSGTPAALYAVLSSGTNTNSRTVSRSTDGGVTWNPVDLGETVTSVATLEFSPGFEHTVYAVTDEWERNGSVLRSSLYRSTDAGASWQNLSCDGVTDYVCSLVAAPGSAEALYITTTDGLFRWGPEEY